MEVHNIPKCVSLKVNVMARLEFELTYYNAKRSIYLLCNVKFKRLKFSCLNTGTIIFFLNFRMFFLLVCAGKVLIKKISLVILSKLCRKRTNGRSCEVKDEQTNFNERDENKCCEIIDIFTLKYCDVIGK